MKNLDGIRLSHIFKIASNLNEKPSISIKIPNISNQKLDEIGAYITIRSDKKMSVMTYTKKENSGSKS